MMIHDSDDGEEAAARRLSLSGQQLLQQQQQQEQDEPMLQPPPKYQSPLINVKDVDAMFKVAANYAVTAYVTLLSIVYGVTTKRRTTKNSNNDDLTQPRDDELAYLPQGEREAAAAAFGILAIAAILLLVPVVLSRKRMAISGIIYAAIAIQSVALTTNFILAFCPTIVAFDAITNSRVFLVRWCEWIPLAGLMTFLSEAVDIPKTKNGLRNAVLASLTQSLSCVCGLAFPFCTGVVSWCIVMTISIITWLPIFPRVMMKRKNFKQANVGKSFLESENYERLRFSYELLLICSCVWSILVILYFYNMVVHTMCPEGHYLRNRSHAMMIDTLFDVIAKAIYTHIIVEVHRRVFDPSGRANRQLGELRSLMNVLWDSSSDAIVISVMQDDRITSMLSPCFPSFVGGSLPTELVGRKSTALFLDIDKLSNPQGDETSININNASYVDSGEIPHGGMIQESVLAKIGKDSLVASRASDIIATGWNVIEGKHHSPLTMYSIPTVDGGECKCELKVSRNSDNTIIAIARDVTERYKRFEAERRVHIEAMARQKEAQSQTRFVRHEVKNGLLAGIELCDSLRNSIDDLEKAIVTRNNIVSGEPGACTETTRRCVEELDITLHEVLDTVLAEAMARDVIHEVYQPRLERLDVKGLLSSSGSMTGKADRFKIEVKEELPFLQMDPQLLRHIYRNAVSNACKYGKTGGLVVTRLSFDANQRQFEMQVVNEPGVGHNMLLKLGESARDNVFKQGESLHNDLDHVDKYISSGDGAWIMQKCAKVLKGKCDIKFEANKTVFSFCCPAEPLLVPEYPNALDFAVPPDTLGIAVDDSRIQRKLCSRILSHAGVEESRQVIVGEKPSDVHKLEDTMRELLEANPTSKLLVLMDENLDYGGGEDDHVILSGSAVMKQILSNLPRKLESSVFALVRSANDSADDVAQYLGRTHGFFPKAPMQRERVLEILAPLWAERFLVRKLSRATSGTSLHSDDFKQNQDLFVEKEELLFSLEFVDSLVRDCLTRNVSWAKLWSSLHSLKGDLMILESTTELKEVIAAIGKMKGPTFPDGFNEEWQRLHRVVKEILHNIE